MSGRGVRYGIVRAQADGTLWLPGGIVMRIGAGAAGGVLPFPLVGVMDDGVNSPVVFIDTGPTPLVTEKTDGGRGYPSVVIAGLTPGVQIAFLVAQTEAAARFVAAGGQLGVDASGRAVVIGSEVSGNPPSGKWLAIAGQTIAGTISPFSLTPSGAAIIAGITNGGSANPVALASAGGMGLAQPGQQTLLVTGPPCWSVPSQPAVAVAPVATKALAGGIRHIATSVTVNVEAVNAQADLIFNLRDGASGAGAVLWTIRLALAAGQSYAQTFLLPNLPGTAATAMTLEAAAAPAAGNFASVVLTGFDAG